MANPSRAAAGRGTVVRVRAEVLTRVAAGWASVAGLTAGFTPERITMGTVASSGLCPEGWVGVVWLGLSRASAGALVSAPDDDVLAVVARRLAGVAPADVTDQSVWAAPADDDVRGPSTLAYLDADDFRPHPSPRVDRLAPSDAIDEVVALEEAAGRDDARLVGLRRATSPLFVVRDSGRIVAAGGYEIWRGTLAHMVVLTHPRYRRRGLATFVAGAATRYALDAGLTPQWRTVSDSSRGVASALGYAQVGGQMSILVR